MLTLSWLNSHSTLISLSALMHASWDWNTLGIFLRAAFSPERGLRTALHGDDVQSDGVVAKYNLAKQWHVHEQVAAGIHSDPVHHSTLCMMHALQCNLPHHAERSLSYGSLRLNFQGWTVQRGGIEGRARRLDGLCRVQQLQKASTVWQRWWCWRLRR